LRGEGKMWLNSLGGDSLPEERKNDVVSSRGYKRGATAERKGGK